MIVNSSNYPTTTEFLAAILEWLQSDGEVYIRRVKYDLERACQRSDYLVNLLQYQGQNGYLDTYPFPGFEGYTAPAPSFNITYINGFATKVVNTPVTTYQPGVTNVTINIGPLNSSIVITGQEVILNFGGVEYTVNAGDNGAAEFSFVAPSTLTGDIVVTSSLADAASNSIAYATHGSEVDTSIYSISEDSYGFSLVSSQGNRVAVGDANNDGTINVGDVTSALTLYLDQSRNHFYNHATVTLGSLYYYQGIEGTLSFTVTPANTDYLINSTTYGAAKTLDKVSWRFITMDSDGSPNITQNSNGITDFAPTSSDLNSDGSYTGTIQISSDFNNPVLIVASLRTAYNDATIESSNHLGLSASILAGSEFEPNDSIIVSFTDSPSSNAKVTNSQVFVRGYDNAQLTGNPIVQATGIVSANNTVNVSTTVPSTHDKNLYFATGYSFFASTNRVFTQFYEDPSFGTPVDAEALGITASIAVDGDTSEQFYASATDTITVTIDYGANTMGDYNVYIYAESISTSADFYQIASFGAAGTTYTFTPSSGTLEADTNIRVRIAILEQ